ncbi:MAG: diacylglycerol kinase [Verrucomicrobiota bacterium]|jgi:diacylglycerol kinase (ATP)
MDKTCIILNPAAGKARDLEDVVARLARVPNGEIRISSKPGSAARFASAALRKGFNLVVAAGGDGTLNEVVNGIGENLGDARLGLIPLGTGNDFARTIGVPDDIEAAIDLIVIGETRAVDLVRVTSDEVRYFVNVSAGGFSGLVNEKLTPEMKKTWGPLAYLRGAAAALPELRAYRTTLALDNSESLTLDLYNVVVANGRYVAGGTLIAPEASIDDGLLDIVLIPQRSAPELALLAAQVALGTHLASEAIVFRRAAQLTVNSKPGMWFNVDGELVGNEPARFEILPRALSFIAPTP